MTRAVAKFHRPVGHARDKARNTQMACSGRFAVRILSGRLQAG